MTGLFSKLVALVSAAFLGLFAAPGGGHAGATTHPHSTAAPGVSTSGLSHDSGAPASGHPSTASTTDVPGIAGISSALSALGNGVGSCVTKALSSAGTISSASSSQLVSVVTACITSAANSAQLPGGAGKCATAIMSTVDSALAGKAPSFDISACIPTGLGTGIPATGSPGSVAGGSGTGGSGTGESQPDLSGLSSALSGIGGGVVSCVLKAVTAAGAISSANSSRLSSQVTACVTSALGSAPLPGGTSSCASSIMALIHSALAGHATPSFDVSACIPSGFSGFTGFSGFSGLGHSSGMDGHTGMSGLSARSGGVYGFPDMGKLFGGSSGF